MTADGTRVELLANINNLADAQAAQKVGATGVGLFRTEYLFLTHPDVPGEEEQYEYYRQIILGSPNQSVTIRTLDLGGDKTVPYLGRRSEPNPFMGWRSTRIFFENSKLFVTQIRAILRASRHGHVSMLFPMITTLEELLHVNKLVKETRHNLRREGVAFGEDVKTGVMVEVPAAAICIDSILRETDFISIGSNDLIQYLVAADRDNPKVAHLCESLNPAIFRVLQNVFAACQRTGTPVTLCGEMAGQPRSVLVLFGMGLRKFSMSPAFIPTIKALLALGHDRAGRAIRPSRAPAQHQRGDPLVSHCPAPRGLQHARDVRHDLIGPTRHASRLAAMKRLRDVTIAVLLIVMAGVVAPRGALRRRKPHRRDSWRIACGRSSADASNATAARSRPAASTSRPGRPRCGAESRAPRSVPVMRPGALSIARSRRGRCPRRSVSDPTRSRSCAPGSRRVRNGKDRSPLPQTHPPSPGSGRSARSASPTRRA